jgi:hypothetical protein
VYGNRGKVRTDFCETHNERERERERERESPEYLMIANVYFRTHTSFKKNLTIKSIEKCDFRFFRVVITITVFWETQC